jgi:hypothetical protein
VYLFYKIYALSALPQEGLIMQEEIIKTGGVTQAVEHLLSKYKALSPITSIIIKEGIIKSFLPLKKYNQILQLN